MRSGVPIATWIFLQSVLHLLIAIQHLVPATNERFLEYQIEEGLPANTTIGDLLIDDELDQRYEPAVVASLRFSFLTKPRPDRSFFTIDEVRGIIRTNAAIDREKICPSAADCVSQFDIAVRPFPYFRIIKVKVEILDVNDNAPEFPERKILREVLESADVGTGLVVPAAVDLDSAENSVKLYELNGNSAKFQLVANIRLDGSTDLKLVIRERLDREEEDSYKVTVVAIDGGAPPISGSIIVVIVVLDANDNNPEFDNSTYEVRVAESATIGSVVTRVRATDKDLGLNGLVTYQFSRHTLFEYGHLFGIRNEAGKIFLKKELDYESTNVFLLSVIAADRGQDSLQSHASVLIRVEDVNDNSPRITTRTLSGDRLAEVTEDAGVGAFVAYVSVSDEDSGDNGNLHCFLDSSIFAPRNVQTSEFRISIAAPLDREERDSYALSITCVDHGVPARTSVAELLVRILDVNDNAPRFSRDFYEVTVEENSDVEMPIVRVIATDRDLGPNAALVYTIMNENAIDAFEIDHKTGEVRSLVAFDREERDLVEFQVVAMDQGFPVRSAEVLVRVIVSDLDDEMPQFEEERYTFEVRENQPAGFQMGQVVAYDRDSAPFDQFFYTLEPEVRTSEIFQVDAFSGDVIVKESLDRETTPHFAFYIFATSGNFTASTHVTVHVTDMNDNRPVFVFPSGGAETIVISGWTAVGVRVARLKALDVDVGDNATLSYYISGGNAQNLFAVDPLTGILTVKQDLRSFIDQKGFLLKVTAKDGGDPPLTDSAELGIVMSLARDDMDSAVALPIDGVLVAVLSLTLSVAMASMLGVVVVVCVIRRRRPLTSVFYREVRAHLDKNHLGAMTSDHSLLSDRGSATDRNDPALSNHFSNGKSYPNNRSLQENTSEKSETNVGKEFVPQRSQIDIRPSAVASSVYWMERGAEICVERGLKNGRLQSPPFAKEWPRVGNRPELVKREELSGKSPRMPILCHPELADEVHKPVVVFVKDQRELERCFLTGRPNLPESTNISCDIRRSFSVSDPINFRSSQTLPIRFVQRKPESNAQKRDRSSLGHYSVVWPVAQRMRSPNSIPSSPSPMEL